MNLMLGKLPARKDKRTLQLKTILTASNLPPLLLLYDIDIVLAIIDTAVYLNDQLGDCVEAGSAHAIQRFEKYECGCQPKLPDTDIRKQYFKETGGADEGLVLLDHLNLWRKEGLDFGGRNYKIYAFASIHWKDHKEVSYAIQLLRGAYLGFQVPKFFMDGFEAGKRSFDAQCKGKQIEGGHCVYACAFNKTGPVIVTWGARVQLTWKFWDKYVDEVYAIIDAPDPWVDAPVNPLNISVLEGYLNSLS
jgi:hypothetical protein